MAPDSPLAASVTRYATVTFCRARHGLGDKLSAGDIAELDALAPALPARDDLTVRTSRTVWRWSSMSLDRRCGMKLIRLIRLSARPCLKA